MGGGESKTSQIQKLFTDSFTKIVNSEMNEESYRIEQSGITNQVIDGLVIKPFDGCPFWAPPRNLTVSQEAISAATIVQSIERLNTADLTNKIVNNLEAMSSNTVEKKKDGMLAFTDKTNVDQCITVSDRTRTEIERSIKNSISSTLGQHFQTGQRISNTTIYTPCGDTAISQSSVTETMASMFGRNVTQTVMGSIEVHAWVTKVSGTDKQTATDPFNSLFNNASAAVGSVSAAFGAIGSAWVIGIVLVLGLLLFVLPSGGGGGNRGD